MERYRTEQNRTEFHISQPCPTPSSPDMGCIEGFCLLPCPLLLCHGHPPPSGTLLGPLTQMSHPGEQAGCCTPCEQAGEPASVLAEDEASLVVRECSS
eukprot:GFUD01046175.1.p1 GENE.GFUD01046175.1~~GFUD01046175.1.p1  ORF type:complete len:114 (-),score=28.10 GFUD01046175.1:114-407(-)